MLPIKLDIPDSFFEEEERSGYRVSKKMKEVWAVELDLLAKFISVCDKYDLKYFVMGGTLLGAVRHKGFIPWDDDIDVIMPRTDYEKLLEIGEKEFESPYFFSTPETEYKFWRSHIQIRNSNTTGAIKNDEKRNNNKGIFIDVFVLDNVPDEKSEREAHRKEMSYTYKWVSLSMEIDNIKKEVSLIKYIILRVCIAFFANKKAYAKAFKKFNRVSSKYLNSNTMTVAHTALSYREAVVWEKKWFLECEKIPFEMLEVCVPKNYNDVLEKHYGKNYMEIPREHPETSHGKIFFDTTKPYTFYYK